MKWRGWTICLLPGFVGFLIAGAASTGLIPNHVLYMRGRVTALAVIFGTGISAIAVAGGLLWARQQDTHRRAAAALQRQAVEDRRRFLQRLDHELKNPLTAIEAGLTNLTYEPLDDYLAGEAAAVKAQVRRISQLVADLRKLAVLGSTPLETTKVDLAELLSEIVAIANERLHEDSRKISLMIPNAPWPLPEIDGDPDLLGLMVHNLLDNAIKFTRADDTIEVRAFDAGSDAVSEVVIEVADTGPGIPESEIERVWDELYRGEKARGLPGSGLGLPLVRAIADQHRGTVQLRSRSNQGTVFSVHLPTRH